MIDLRNYYLRHATDYYNNFRNLVLKAPEYKFYDSVEILEAFRDISKPEQEVNYELHNDRYIMLCFWLNKNGYSIDEFPNLLSRPKSLRNFAYDNIRSYLRKHNSYADHVPWADRRALCDSMTIRSNGKFQYAPNEVEEKIRLISTRNADFDSMATDEKLATLNNLIENLLKNKGKYVDLNYDKVFYGYFTEEQVKDYRKKTHCFRHAAMESLLERKRYSDDEKILLIDLGVFVVIHIQRYLARS